MNTHPTTHAFEQIGTHWSENMRAFIKQHINDDTCELLLSASRYGDIDMQFAAHQIESRRKLRDKLPEWYDNDDIVMGGKIPAEQCSSEKTARFKRSIIQGRSLCDLTGGMGVDFWYMSEGMDTAIYTERDAWLCECAEHNMAALSASRNPSAGSTIFLIRHGDGRLLPIPDVDVIYLDPARRSSDGGRVYAIEDCEPNVLDWQDLLLSHASTVLVKLSPMIDLSDMLSKMSHVTDVYIVAVRNECKEMLVKMQAESSKLCEKDKSEEKGESLESAAEGGGRDVVIHCVDFMPTTTISHAFVLSDSKPVRVTDEGVMRYLFEPDVTLMKAQAFGSLCHDFDVVQLDVQTHLMTSASPCPNFPGRRFEVEEVIPFSSHVVKRLPRLIPKANISTRNFVLTADQLRKKTGIKDGGDIFLFGASVKGEGNVIIRCKKI